MTDHRTLSTQHKSLKATTVNINAFSKHSYEIVHQYMVTNSVQISCVTETKKQNTEVHDFPGYLTLPNNSSSNPGQSGGVLLALEVNIKPSVFKLEIEIQHSTWAICNVSRKSILVGGVYCRPYSIEEMKRVLYEIRSAIKKEKIWACPIFFSLATSMQGTQTGATKAMLKGKP